MKVSDKVLAPLAVKATIWTNEILHSTASNKVYLWSAFKQFRKSRTGLLLFWCFGRGCVGVLSTQSASSAASMQGPPPALSFSACLWDLLCNCVPANWCCSFPVFPVWLKSSSLTRTTYLSRADQFLLKYSPQQLTWLFTLVRPQQSPCEYHPWHCKITNPCCIENKKTKKNKTLEHLFVISPNRLIWNKHSLFSSQTTPSDLMHLSQIASF